MSSNPAIQTRLTHRKHFEFTVELEDPNTSLTTNFPMEVDTGCPIELALPRYCATFFTDYQGTASYGGAGSSFSPMYSATIKSVGGMDIDFDTYAVMTLDDDQDYGLLGIDFLKYMRTEIDDDPSQKALTLEKTHL